MVEIAGTEYSGGLETISGGADMGPSYLQSYTSEAGEAGMAGGSFGMAESFESFSGDSSGMAGGFAGAEHMALGGGPGGAYSSSYFESSGDATGIAGIDASGLGLGGGAAYESSYYSSQAGGGADLSVLGGGAGGAGFGFAGGFGSAGGFGGAEGYGMGAGGAGGAGGAVSMSSETVEVAGGMLPLSAYKIQVDSNPTVMRKTIAGYGPSTYRQNILIRFLKPPTPPAPGPLIIREVRPPQPKPAPPLVIKQRPPRPKTPPPLILREKPPRVPAIIRTQTITKRLAALPAPPRQVIIERYPALPPKPRDIIIERWLQYGPIPKRKVIYQRSAVGRVYKAQKNLIVQYMAPRPHVQRVFRRLGVTAANPSAYLSTYGSSLLDASSLISTARTAGVVENISPPAVVLPAVSSLSVAGGLGGGAGAVSSFESTEMISGGGMGAGMGVGIGSGMGASMGGGYAAGFGADLGGAAGYNESASYTTTELGGGVGGGHGGYYSSGFATGGMAEGDAGMASLEYVGGGMEASTVTSTMETSGDYANEVSQALEGGQVSYEQSYEQTIS